MSIFSRILALLNLIAVIVTLFFLSQVYVARLSWQRALRNLEEQRDGVATDVLRELVKNNFPDQVNELDKNPPQSQEALRKELLLIIFPPDKPELLADAHQTQSLLHQYGLSYDDLRLVSQQHLSRVRNELRIEEQNLRIRRRELEIRRRRLEDDIRLANERLIALNAQVQIEQDQHAKIAALISERRKDVVFWTARLAEAFAAWQVTEALLEDMRTDQKQLEARRDKLLQDCLDLERRIADMEKLAQGR
ncbi:MAG: hypothetical protein RMJ19_11045 [Gemmatales bacterium]|nr:hypothetical protein [Gemmatales bacterium]MCS7160996.1 hypothetical protein [Gemmatales bacterium]MDW8176199.1 hypothetical protein [Gemmatales bacterium]MDW8223744.1 hypothetical protein [Gemmatales bacterium]